MLAIAAGIAQEAGDASLSKLGPWLEAYGAVLLGDPKAMATYVLAGYGADSIAALASQRLDDLSGVVSKDIAGKLG